MINTDLLVNAVVSTLQTIPDLVTALNGDPTRIFPYHYIYGIDAPLETALYEVKPPCIMVAWENTLPGDFDGTTLWKHTVNVYMRTGNQALASPPITPAYLWWMIINLGVNSTAVNIRYTQILKSGSTPLVDIMDTPAIEHMKDENGMDFFIGRCTFPELGDNN